jgi:hypothetical protein
MSYRKLPKLNELSIMHAREHDTPVHVGMDPGADFCRLCSGVPAGDGRRHFGMLALK